MSEILWYVGVAVYLLVGLGLCCVGRFIGDINPFASAPARRGFGLLELLVVLAWPIFIVVLGCWVAIMFAWEEFRNES